RAGDVRGGAADGWAPRLSAAGASGLGGAAAPRLIAALAGAEAWLASLDPLMAARGPGRPGVPPRRVGRRDLVTHPRARLAARLRGEPPGLGYPDPRPSPLATPSRGLARPTELSFELEPGGRGPGGRPGPAPRPPARPPP